MASTGLDGKLECSGMTEKKRGKAGGKEFLHQYKMPDCALSGQEIQQFRRDLLAWFAGTCFNWMIRPGITGMIRPQPMQSIRSVTNMKPSADFFAVRIDGPLWCAANIHKNF